MFFPVVTTALPEHTDSTVTAGSRLHFMLSFEYVVYWPFQNSETVILIFPVVIVLILLTLAGLAFLLYRYMCHNKGDYRTTGELAPGEDPDEDHNGQALREKTEYFI